MRCMVMIFRIVANFMEFLLFSVSTNVSSIFKNYLLFSILTILHEISKTI